jgi:hypothetical protein
VPAAIIIEILIAGHVGRNILGATDAILVFIATQAPAAEGVLGADPADVIAELIDSRKCALLAFGETIGISRARNLAFTAPDGRNRLIAIGIHVQAELPWADGVESEIGGIDLEAVISRVMAHPEE